jgi:hypothetical protein
MSSIEYSIEIYTGTNITEPDLGMVSGVIRVVTGKPNLSGVAWGDNEIYSGLITDTFYNNFLVNNSLSNPSRQIDISKTGDYGSLSNFSFKFDNSKLYWYILNVNNINLINKETRVYTIIDNKFYQIWTGNITQVSRDDYYVTFNCEDGSSGIHKMLPKDIVNEKTIPVILGDNAYTPIVNITEEDDLYDISDYNNTKIATIREIIPRNSNGRVHLEWYIDGTYKNIPEGDKPYLKYIYGGDPSNDRSISDSKLIKLSNIYINPFTEFATSYDFFETDVPVYVTKDHIYPLYKYENLHMYRYIYNNDNYANIYVSLGDINNTFSATAGNSIDNNLYVYNSITTQYDKIAGEIENIGSGLYNVVIPNTNTEGSFEYYSPLDITINSMKIMIPEKDELGYFTNPKNWSEAFSSIPINEFVPTVDIYKLSDSDQTTYIDCEITNNYIEVDDITSMQGVTPSDIFLKFDITVNSDITNDIDDIYVLPDFLTRVLDEDDNELDISGYCQLVCTPRTKNNNDIAWQFDFNNGIDYVYHDPDRYYLLDNSKLGITGSGTQMVNFNIPREYYTTLMEEGDGSGIYPETFPNINNYNTSFSDVNDYFDVSGVYGEEGWLKEKLIINSVMKDYLKLNINKSFSFYVRIYFPGHESNVKKVELKINQLSSFFTNTQSLKHTWW